MKELIKTISGQSCDVYAVSHHDRIRIGTAIPKIEIYENRVYVPTIGTNSIRYKRTVFSVVICPTPDMDEEMTSDILQGLTSFDLAMTLPRKDNVLVPFSVYGVVAADLSPDCWSFEITDTETVRKLLSL